jgi:pimeloyl-ACP methyl ester carboxylesterase
MTSEFADIDWAGRTVRIEHEWHRRDCIGRPLLVFLHEGLGSVAMWKDFPASLCEAADVRGLVYSRPGYGRSSPRAPDERWQPDFMHRQAHEVLPALLRALAVEEQPWLFGHSDGGSIALLYAARFPRALAGAIVVAPHIFTEPFGLASIRQAREAYDSGDLKRRLARYHDDVDSAFRGWNDIWLDPAFEAWNIEAELPAIACPLLAVQGVDDEYGTLAQIRGIAAAVRQTELVEIPACGHSPHRDRPQALVAAVVDFLGRHAHHA